MSKTELSISGELPQFTSIVEVESILERILADLGEDQTLYRVSLAIVDSPRMRHINHTHRGVDAVTDVLSFVGDKLPLSISETIKYVRLCDIVIDINQVLREKEENTYTEEFWQVLIHGILHVAGYDHIKAYDKKIMEDAEENYRSIVREGIIRG